MKLSQIKRPLMNALWIGDIIHQFVYAKYTKTKESKLHSDIRNSKN
jgi:hypothetical protein